MTTTETNDTTPKPPARATEGAWAKRVQGLDVGALPRDAVNLNVQGKQLAGPVRGFGQMWQKTYRIIFEGAQPSPQDVIRAWKAHFGSFWPKGNHFFSASDNVAAGDVAVLNLGRVGQATLISTGVMVIYTDDESFSFMTPEGHIFAAFITFSADDDADGKTSAQIQALVRANDPIYELTFRMGGGKVEDVFWMNTLRNVAAHFGATGSPTCKSVCVDPTLRWSEAKNIRHNAGLRTALFMVGAPVRWVRRLVVGR